MSSAGSELFLDIARLEELLMLATRRLPYNGTMSQKATVLHAQLIQINRSVRRQSPLANGSESLTIGLHWAPSLEKLRQSNSLVALTGAAILNSANRLEGDQLFGQPYPLATLCIKNHKEPSLRQTRKTYIQPKSPYALTFINNSF